MSFQIVVDFGLVVLIWMVQLIVYPSFLFMDSPRFDQWHSQYTVLITFIVMPLMLTQLVLHFMNLLAQPSLWQVTQVAMIISVWGITFLKAVPLHNRIRRGDHISHTIKSLIFWNWPRTFFWSMIFLISLFQEVYG